MSVRTGIFYFVTLILAYGLSALFTGLLIPWLRKLKFGQNIREDGPQGHLAKQGTPTMGGIAFIPAAVIAVLPAIVAGEARDDAGLGMAIALLSFVGFGFVGFLDDYLKIRKKQNEGLTVKQKFALEIALGIVIAVLRVNATSHGTMFLVPFAWTYIDLKFWAYPFIVFIVVAMTNAVNLTDGLDGLASSVTAVNAVFFFLIAEGTLSRNAAHLAIALFGACLGFLLYNHNPAKVFMGDTGSLALGGALAGIALLSDSELLLPVAGIVYVAEALSVILQVAYFKKTHGKRLFRMAPLHHHFELGGWNEKKVVRVFSLVTALFCAIALVSAL